MPGQAQRINLSGWLLVDAHCVLLFSCGQLTQSKLPHWSCPIDQHSTVALLMYVSIKKYELEDNDRTIQPTLYPDSYHCIELSFTNV